jgi:tetratricopeptide (TPR) repeat protein
MELAATEQIAISSEDISKQSGASALTLGRTGKGARRSNRSAIALVASAIALVLAGWGIHRGISASHGARAGALDAATPQDAPSQMSSNPDATAAYRAGLQALRDGSMLPAINQFTRATELDPLFGAAQLRLVLTNILNLDVTTITDADLKGAHASQASLGAHDKILLEAFEPIARVPPDFTEAQRVLEAAVQKYPSDGEFPFQLGIVLDWASKPADAVKALDVSIAKDPSFAFAWRMKAAALIELDDVEGAGEALHQCLKVSPTSTTCLADQSRIEASDGKCDELVKTSRRLMALIPDTSEPYLYLAEGLLGSGESLDAVQAALQQLTDRMPAANRPLSQAQFAGALAIMRGDFLGAERAYQECERLTASQPDDVTRFHLAYDRVLVALEIGHLAESRELADAYLRKRAGLSQQGWDHSLAMDSAELRAGQMTRPAFTLARDAWLARGADDPVFRWVTAFALPALTREDAEAALAAKPDVRPLVSRPFLRPDLAEPIGRVYSLAGQLDEGTAFLRTATASCALLEGDQAIFSSWAALDLGRALEQRGDVPGACAAYGRVLARWGSASPPSKTAASALARSAALRCSPEPARPH